MHRTLLVPGLDGSEAPHWQHWWAVTDPSALMVDLSNPAHPDPETWEAELAGLLLQHPESVLVGHSLGAVLSARVLARWPQLRVRAALLVAPAEPSVSPRTSPFGGIPQVKLPVPVTLAGSRNDPWMSFSQARSLSKVWGAELCDLGFAGHVNVASGFGPWPEGKALRDDLLLHTDPREQRAAS
jgi:predicted alpha/beta hydrolase family esterase